MGDKTEALVGGSSDSQRFVRWLVVGIPGVGLLFVASVHLPDTIKVPGLFAVGLAVAAGWGLGRWGLSMNIRPTLAVALAAWFAIAGGEVISSVKTNSDRVTILRKQPKYQDATQDPIIEGVKRSLDAAPAAQSEEDRRQRQEIRDDIEAGESRHRERLEHLTYYGFLQERIPKAWGKWSSPWPAVFWGAEVVLGSTLGAWLTLFTLRNASPCDRTMAAQIVGLGADERGDRG